MKYDLIIVGSGSVGAAAGYYATRAGLNVLMTDAWLPPHQHGSHHGDTRLIRHAYGEGEKYVPLVLRAQSLWDALAADSGEAVFERTGVINLGPADSAFLANVAHSAREFNLEVERLDADALMARWPEIRVPEGYIGLFESQSGLLRSELAVKTWIRLAREAGCAQLFNCPVTAIHHHDDGVTIDTADGQYSGAKLLVSAGTWVTRLLPSLPVQPVRKIDPHRARRIRRAGDESASAPSLIPLLRPGRAQRSGPATFQNWHTSCYLLTGNGDFLRHSDAPAPPAIDGSTNLVHPAIYASKRCGAPRKNKQYRSKIFTLSQTKC